MKALYIEDSYRRDFDATVESALLDRITLDKTAFYPASGGQPSDLGIILRDGEEFKVLKVEALDCGIVHIVDKEGLQPGNSIHALLDFERRYRLMRSHTACHILSAVIFKETGAKITGNQIDLSRSRVDFSLDSFDKAKMNEYIGEANRLIRENRPVKTRVLPRDEALRIPDLIRLAMDLPDREEIRVVEIEGIDTQACGGTHVKSTGEVIGIKMIKAENKGKSNRRVYFALED